MSPYNGCCSNFAFVLLIVQTVVILNYGNTVAGEVCGKRMWKEPTARIINGNDAEFGDWPWMVGIYRTSSSSGDARYHCGASLVNSNWVLTAAHCVYNDSASDIILKLGDLHRDSENEALPFVERRVKEIILYPNYSAASLETNDMALLRLNKSITFQKHILPICLPKGPADYSGKKAYATGWGLTSRRNGIAAVKLQESKVPIIDHDDCQYLYKMSSGPTITDKHICSGGSTYTAHQCHGDSGGPLVVHDDQENRFVIIGVISFGVDCGSSEVPGASTRVDAYMDWITPIISQK